jgi:hypothetical protein
LEAHARQGKAQRPGRVLKALPKKEKADSYPKKRGANKSHDVRSDTSRAGKLRAVPAADKVRFEVFGAELMEKQVSASGKSGRVYLPAHWLGKKVKIIRVD